jgi:hypothetical protein
MLLRSCKRSTRARRRAGPSEPSPKRLRSRTPIDEGVEETISDGPKGQTVTRKRVDRLGHRSLRIGVRQWHAERMLAKLASKHALVGADGKVANIVPVINMTVLAAPKEDSK